jgi:hypothetical protein
LHAILKQPMLDLLFLIFPSDYLKSLTSEVTPSANQFFKRSYKISHNPGL